MHIAILSPDQQIQHDVQRVAQQMGVGLTTARQIDELQHRSFDILLWHLVDADDAKAKAIVALERPRILLIRREQLDDRLGSGQLFKTPLPSLPEPVWYLILPFLDDELELLISTIARRLGI